MKSSYPRFWRDRSSMTDLQIAGESKFRYQLKGRTAGGGGWTLYDRMRFETIVIIHYGWLKLCSRKKKIELLYPVLDAENYIGQGGGGLKVGDGAVDVVVRYCWIICVKIGRPLKGKICDVLLWWRRKAFEEEARRRGGVKKMSISPTFSKPRRSP